jgi:hypothetical protein
VLPEKPITPHKQIRRKTSSGSSIASKQKRLENGYIQLFLAGRGGTPQLTTGDAAYRPPLHARRAGDPPATDVPTGSTAERHRDLRGGPADGPSLSPTAAGPTSPRRVSRRGLGRLSRIRRAVPGLPGDAFLFYEPRRERLARAGRGLRPRCLGSCLERRRQGPVLQHRRPRERQGGFRGHLGPGRGEGPDRGFRARRGRPGPPLRRRFLLRFGRRTRRLLVEPSGNPCRRGCRRPRRPRRC